MYPLCRGKHRAAPILIGGVSLASSPSKSNGPDAMDVAQSIAAIQDYHQVDVTLVITRDGLSGFSGLRITAVATRRMPAGLEARRSVSRWRRFPSNDVATMEGTLFRLVHELDNDCSEMWKPARMF